MAIHIPVLLYESIEGLNLKKGMTVVDATLGGGGHTREILKKIMPGGTLVAIDRDQSAIESFQKKIASEFPEYDSERIILAHSNFSNIKNVLAENDVQMADGILADFGISSFQLESETKGMSFKREMPLDMRMDASDPLTAYTIVNEWSEKEITRVLYEYGEETNARRIARTILDARNEKRIETTTALAEIVRGAIPGHQTMRTKIDPATKTFQALRIAVNNELEHIALFIPAAIESLRGRGRLAIITFHSGEDKIAKRIARQYARGCICPPALPLCVCGQSPIVKLITKKPIIPTKTEVEHNPRARSAKLRIIEKIPSDKKKILVV